MGKNSKQRKKRRFAEANTSTTLFAPKKFIKLTDQPNLDNENDQSVLSDASIFPNDNDIDITVKTLEYLNDNPQLFMSKDFKKLRTILHQIHNAKGQTLTGRVSDALRDGRLDEANIVLCEMRNRNQIPKLGALQRWVRDCDAASADDGSRTSSEVYRTLDYILRTADPLLVKQIHCQSNESDSDNYPIIAHDNWHPYEPSTDIMTTINTPPYTLSNTIQSKFRIIYRELGCDRKPANMHDMMLYTSDTNTIDTSQYELSVSRIDIPKLPGAFVLKNVLSPYECHQIMSAAESIGFTPDTPFVGSAKHSHSTLAHNFFWLADTNLLNILFNRCQAFLPDYIGKETNEKLAGLNARWRVYRYEPGSVYRPHIDGAWPGSGVNDKGEYVYDIYGDRLSKLTFLIRLNHGFRGGATTFFTPSLQEGVLDARPICPFAGDVLMFPHGSSEGSLLHEGSAVIDTRGECYDAKYVIRTEVLYTTTS